MEPLQILGIWAACAAAALIYYALAIQPQNRDAWLVVVGMAAFWFLTVPVLIALGFMSLFEGKRP